MMMMVMVVMITRNEATDATGDDAQAVIHQRNGNFAFDSMGKTYHYYLLTNDLTPTT